MMAGSPPPWGGRVLGLNEHGLNLRHPREARQFIRVEVRIQNLAVLEMDFLGQRIAQPHGGAAFHLYLRPFRVDHQAHVLGADHAFDLNGSLRRIHLGLDDHGSNTGAGVHATSHAIAAFAGRFGRSPAEALGEAPL